MKQSELFKDSFSGGSVLVATIRDNGERLGLTPRQIEIVQLLAFGKVQKQAAEELKISIHTLNNHVRLLYARLGVGNIAHAVAILASKVPPG